MGIPYLWLDGVARDLSSAVRSFAKAPRFTLSVVVNLTVGIASILAAASFTNGLVVRSFPGVVAQDQLVEIRLRSRCGEGCWAASTSRTADYALFRGGIRGLSDIASSTIAEVAVRDPEAHSRRTAFVSDNYFALLGTKAALGRFFTPGERAEGAVISHSLWTRQFNRDPLVLGHVIALGSQVHEIIGVAPVSFGGLDVRIGEAGPDLWLPLGAADSTGRASPGWQASVADGEHYIRYFGRLAGDVPLKPIEAQATVLAANIALSRGAKTDSVAAEVMPVRMHDPVRFAPIIVAVLGVPILVLCISCMNAASLLLARAASRGHDIALRFAIGASRGRVVRHLLAESLMLAAGATLVAIPLVAWAMRLAADRLFVPMPIDRFVAAVALAICALTTVGCGLLPAFRATRAPAAALTASRQSSGTRRDTRLRRMLVAVQVALSLALLAVSGQLISLLRASERSGGVDGGQLVIAAFDLNQLRMDSTAAANLYRRLLERVSVLPHVEAAGLAAPRAIWTFGKGRQRDNSVVVWRESDGPKQGGVHLGGYAGGELFEALGLRIVEGRGFTASDAVAPVPTVAIVNTRFSEELLGRRAIGHLLRVGPRGKPYASATTVRVIGVIESAIERTYARDGRPVPAVYLPAPIQQQPELSLYVRTSADSRVTASAIRQIVREVDPSVPVVDIGSLAELNEKMMPETTLARGAAILGVVALILAAGGLYAMVSYSVAARAHDIAVFFALGATRGRVMATVVREAASTVFIGGTVGALGAFLSARLVYSGVHGAGTGDLTELVKTGALLLLVSLGAVALPVFRASRIDPISAIKER